ncbi:plasmid IncI1-type surface exclusion protein ExcA, partial [Pseudomonas viridiflava]|uniref:plasmid IncI1-type surface exclusion protein ExcA n=2 Tax=Pseudomonas TaxID=286 RepID=UPI0013DA9134
LSRVTEALKAKDVFWPDDGYEFYLVNDGKYFGIDTKNGAILYIHKIRKGQVDVVGLTMGDWTNRELEGNKLRLYTKFPELPCIEISTPWAQRWYDTLGAMEY